MRDHHPHSSCIEGLHKTHLTRAPGAGTFRVLGAGTSYLIVTARCNGLCARLIAGRSGVFLLKVAEGIWGLVEGGYRCSLPFAVTSSLPWEFKISVLCLKTNLKKLQTRNGCHSKQQPNMSHNRASTTKRGYVAFITQLRVLSNHHAIANHLIECDATA